MSGFSSNKRRAALKRLIVLQALICSLLFSAAPDFAQKRSRAPRTNDQGAGTLLGRGDILYRSNDISDKADYYYKEVVRLYPGSEQAGYAQYNRGSYWQRKYYIVKERYGKEDKGALVEAEGQYYNFVDKFGFRGGPIGLVSDAEFNLSLVYLQEGNREYATGWLYRMLKEATDRDKVVHIYKVVWSSNAEDVIDRDVDASELAKTTIGLINGGRSFEEVVAGIKSWAQGQGQYR
jgi:hypothetical protein